MDKDIAEAEVEAKTPTQEIREQKSEKELLVEIRDLLSEDLKLRQEANKNRVESMEAQERSIQYQKQTILDQIRQYEGVMKAQRWLMVILIIVAILFGVLVAQGF